MSHLYIISFNDHSLEKKLIINADHKLQDNEIQALKNKHAQIKTILNEAINKNKKIVSLDWKDLHIDLLPTASPTTPSVISVSEIAVADMKKLRGPAFSTKLENLLEAKPADIPIVKFVWKMLLGPLLFVSRFLDKNREKALRNLKDLDKSFDYNSSNDYLAEYNKHLGSILEQVDSEKSDKFKALKTHLEEMRTNGQTIQKALEDPQRGALDETSNLFGKQVWDKFSQAKDGQEQHLLSFPAGYYQKGKYQPLLATFFVDKDKKVRLELGILGTTAIQDLQQVYRFDNPSQEKLTEVINGLLVLSTQEKAPKPVKLTRREKIRIKVARQFNVDESTAGAESRKLGKFKPALWLHEKIAISGGMPLKKQSGQPSDRTLTGIVGSDLNHFFPEVPIQEKIELIVKMFEEHYERFIQAQPYLSAAQQEKEFQLLKFKVKKLEDYLVKQVGREEFNNLKTTQQAFDLFFKKMDQLESARTAIKAKRVTRKSSEIDRAFKKGAGTFTYTIRDLTNVKPPQLVQKTKIEKTTEAFGQEIAELKTAIANKNGAETLTHLTSLQKKIDKLIDKKNYLQAKEISIQVLQAFPVPTDNPEDFWAATSKDENSLLIRQITDVNKHIWESSLRLKDKAPTHEQLLQMIKSQVIISKVGNTEINQTDLLDIILLHPHYRFGWLPDQQAEINQIISHLKAYQGSSQRYDLQRKAQLKFLKNGAKQFEIAQGRVQFMTACLMKPDYTLYPYYGTGKVNEAMGINYLDWLVKEAVNRGAKTPQEKSEMIKAIKFEAVQERLNSLGRLDFSSKEYVSLTPGIKIHDSSLLGKNALSYVPYLWATLGGAFEEKYQFRNDQSNTKDFVGATRGEEVYLGNEDEEAVTAFQKVKLKKHYYRANEGRNPTITPQKGHTEPTLLASNLQRDPRGQFSQVDNYNFDTAQVTVDNELSYQSVYETLNLLRTQPYLLEEPEFQRTIIQNISRPGFIIQALEANPLFFETLAIDLHSLIRDRAQSAPFLILLGGILSKHAKEVDFQKPDQGFNAIAKAFPQLDSKLTLGDATKTVKTWLNEWLIDPDRNSASVSMALLFLYYKRPIEASSPNDIARLIHASSIFEVTGDVVGIPQFNAEIRKWLKETILPQIQSRAEKEDKFRNQFFDEWIRLSTSNPTYSSMNWKMGKDNLFINQDFTIDLKNLQIQSRKKTQRFTGQEIPLPFSVARSVVSLFGTQPIKATLRKGASPFEAFYEFTYNGQEYSIYHNQESSQVDVYSKLPIDMKKPEGKKEWFQYLPQKITEEQELSTIEQVIAKNGLWINTKQPKKAYLFSHAPQENSKEGIYKVNLDKKGKLISVKDPLSNRYVVLDKRQIMSQITSFANPNQTLFLARSPKGAVTEVRFLNDNSALKKKRRGDWIYHNDKLGEGYKWLTDLSDAQLLLKERSSAKAFLDSFDGMHEKFILPVSNGKVHTFIIHPYPIVRHKGIAKVEFDYKGNILSQNLPPLTITFDEQGRQEGNPTAFLYLAYYFAHIKNFQMAEHYLDLAKKAANTSASEPQVLTKLEELFQKEEAPSTRTAAFYLKAQLAIKHVRTTQLSQTIYNPADSAEFLNNLLHIAKLYRTYEKRETELLQGALSEEELFEVKRYAQMSMIDYLEKYQEKAASTEQTIGVNFSQFKYFQPKDKTTRPPEILTMLLMADLKKQPSVDKLLNRKFPDPDYMIRQFFHLSFAILDAKEKNPEDLEKIKLFLKSPKSWEIHETKESAENIQLAQFACQYLEILSETPKSISSHELREQLIKLRKGLPYFARNLGVISTLFDTLSFKLEKVKYTQSGIKRVLLEAIENTNIVNPPDFKGTYDEGEGRPMTNLQAVLDVLAAKPESLSPLEHTEIARMITEGDYDLTKPRELIALLRDSEARGFSVLEVRSETELLRQIQKLETEIQNRPAVDPSTIPPLKTGSIPTEFEALKKLFPSKQAVKDSTLQKKLDDLTHKANRLEEYFDKPHKKSTHKEEYRQLKLGLEIAKEKIQDEMELKTEFSKKEIQTFKKLVDEQTKAIGKTEIAARKNLLDHIKQSKALPPSLKKMVDHPEIYTEHQLLNEAFKIYKKLGTANTLSAFDEEITTYLFLSSAYQQFKKAQTLLSGDDPSSSNAARALQAVHAALNEKRYAEADISSGLLSRCCLVAEARDGIIFRKSQLQTIKEFSENPNIWKSLIMGEGKTSYITPVVAEILAELDNFVVITGPQNLIKGNRQTFDKASRTLLDQAGVEFTIPLTEHLPHNLLAEKYVQLLKAARDKGYVVTSVDELCSLHNLIVQLENEKLQLLGDPISNQLKIFFIEKRLHYIRKISQLLHGEAEKLKIKTQFFGDEVDTTHFISNEVNLAMGFVSLPNKTVRDIARNLCEMILNAESTSALSDIKSSLLQDAQSVRTKDEMQTFMFNAAKELQKNPKFLEFLGTPQAAIVQTIPPDEWAGYLTGSINKRPAALPPWDDNDPSLKYISAAKQLLTHTIKGMLSMKTGNDYGLSDYNGFLNVPKTTKNEAEGMRFGDEFELVFTQYLGYIEYLPAQSLTDQSELFLAQALKTYQNKFPTKYDHLIEDFAASQKDKPDEKRLTLIEYFKTPQAWKHRISLLDEVIFDGGYITRFNQQISTNVQEIFHGKNMGGITGTLDPYTLPYISDEVQFNQTAAAKKSSTREVEAETLLRMTLNLPEGIDTRVSIYDDQEPMLHLREKVLRSSQTKAFVNNSGATSEGMDMIAWIKSLRQTPEGESKTYLFRHPKFETTYLWAPGALEPAPYKGQALPPDCVALYGPNDTRGVDQPIGIGDVHFFIGATTSLQEFMQTLYRARRIGSDHKVFLHIPKTWSEQIKPIDPTKGITYGDVTLYIIDRTADNKEGVNEAAQLEKILGQLKTAVSKYLRQTNPKFDSIEFWDRKNLPEFGLYALAESAIFAEVRDLYIKNKEIRFAELYEPVEKISGMDKILNAYDDLQIAIDNILTKLPDLQLEGKTNLIDDLQQLKNDAIEQKKNMQQKIKEHEKFLPEQTTKAGASGKGVKEQVKELQQEKTKTKQVADEPLEKVKMPSEQKRSYIPLHLDGLFAPNGDPGDPVPLEAPFSNFQISLEAMETMQRMGIHRGDPILYLVIANDPTLNKRTMTFVSKSDYHQVLFPALKENNLGNKELHVFSVNPSGFSQLQGTSKYAGSLPDEAIAFKCYLGVKEYHPTEIPRMKNWLQSLTSMDIELLNLFLKEKATQTLYDLTQDLL